MDKMDADLDAPTFPSSSSLKHPSTPPRASTEKRAKLILPQAQLIALNDQMAYTSSRWDWQALIEAHKWPMLLEQVLTCLTINLATTDMKDSVIAPLTAQDAGEMVKKFSKEQFEYWMAGVRNCLKNNDWTDLIAHPTLHKPSMPTAAVGVPIEQQDAVIHAWNSEYRGDAYKVLLEAVDDVHALPTQNNYAKAIPVAQSSGTGKSKTVDMIATERILFPLCLRENIGSNYFAFPPTDTAVREHLLGAPSAKQAEDCKMYLRSFLCSLFALALLQIKQFFPEGSMTSYASMAMKFYDLFKDASQRNDFYEAVIASASSYARASSDLYNSFKPLRQGLNQRCSDWPVKSCPLIISMDEVHTLYTQRDRDVGFGSDHTLYSRLKSVLSEWVSLDLCFVFLSTANEVSKLAPLKPVTTSIREKEDERLLPPPFTELPFDAHILFEPLVSGQETLASVGSLAFTAKFGRPLFYASYVSYTASGVPHETIMERMMLIVREKLCGRSWPPKKPADLNVASIAVLSARLLLDLSPATSDARRFEELVRTHLRMLYSVHQDRQIMVTGSSPEPLIAEASAQIMYHHIGHNGNSKPYMDLWNLLEAFVNSGLAAQGTIGELIGRALSISAMDRAINKLEVVCELRYQTPITVAAYYKAFLTPEAWTILRGSVPINRARLTKRSATETFEDAFANAYFHFSHYGKANDSAPMRDHYSWAAWLRGTAILCQLNQELSDRMAPIYFNGVHNVSPSAMSVNLDQDKTGQSADPRHVGIQSAEKLGIFSKGNKRPYIAAVHCYALTQDEGITVTTPSAYSLSYQESDQEAPRYQIDFRGLIAYGGLSEHTKTAIRTMITGSRNTLFNQHPRKHCVPLLRRMLPVLTEDSDSTAWFRNPEAQTAGPRASR